MACREHAVYLQNLAHPGTEPKLGQVVKAQGPILIPESLALSKTLGRQFQAYHGRPLLTYPGLLM
jgi:hypothetical protein